MCVAFWSLGCADYALILCSNRDEFLSRPTTPAHFHSFGHENESTPVEGDILSGRDQQAGGTWLGIHKTGRVALLTNITEERANYSSSRGHLVSSSLLSSPSSSFEDEVNRLVTRDGRYAGFNLLLLDPTVQTPCVSFDGALVTNHGGGGPIAARPLSSDEKYCGGMSNGIDGSGASDWPKVKHGTKALRDLLDSTSTDTTETELGEHLFELLSWQSREPPRSRTELRNTIQIGPLPMPVTGSASSTVREFYGTRLSTVILVRKNGNVLFIERDIWNLDTDGKPVMGDPRKQRIFRFQVTPKASMPM